MAFLCGVDIIEIDRIKQYMKSGVSGFRDRVYTDAEISYCESRKAGRYESYAARFAAKEAVSKAFGTGMGSSVSWKEIETLNDSKGKPYVKLYGNAKSFFRNIKGVGISISLSHCKLYAVANVILEVMDASGSGIA